MTAAQLLADAAAADREADAIFARVGEGEACPDGGRYLYPAGSRADLEEASSLRRRARHFRAEAAGMSAPPSASTSTVSAPAAPAAPLSPAAKPAGAEDQVAAIAARILASDQVPEPFPSSEVDKVAGRIVASDIVEGEEEGPLEAAARRILAS